MRTDRLEFLAQHLERLPEKKFNINEWDCGTVACIGGWAERLWPDEKAHEALGLKVDFSDGLFYPGPLNNPELADDDEGWEENDLHYRIWSDTNPLKPYEAARVIRHLIATGKIDWRVIDASYSASSE